MKQTIVGPMLAKTIFLNAIIYKSGNIYIIYYMSGLRHLIYSTVQPCKAKMQYLLTLQVSSYCLLARAVQIDIS